MPDHYIQAHLQQFVSACSSPYSHRLVASKQREEVEKQSSLCAGRPRFQLVVARAESIKIKDCFFNVEFLGKSFPFPSRYLLATSEFSPFPKLLLRTSKANREISEYSAGQVEF